MTDRQGIGGVSLRTPTRAGGSPIRLHGGGATAENHEPLPKKGPDGYALLPAGNVAMPSRQSLPPMRQESHPARQRLLPARHGPSQARHGSPPAGLYHSPPARQMPSLSGHVGLPAQQLSLPARRAQLGVSLGSAGVQAGGSAGVQGPLLPARQQATGRAVGSQGLGRRVWKDRLVGAPTRQSGQSRRGVGVW